MAEVVTVHVWRVPPRRVPAALAAVAIDRRRIRALDGVRFAKLLGTGRGETFSPREAEPTRWALVASWSSAEAAGRFERSKPALLWNRRCVESWQAWLRPLASRGEWSRRHPFGQPVRTTWHGPVAAITRARLALPRAVAFWRAVPPVARDLHARPGLCLAFGIGEAPAGVQGTFSLWTDAAALGQFAYGGEAHRRAIRETTRRRWYAEELFARFAVLRTAGTFDGREIR